MKYIRHTTIAVLVTALTAGCSATHHAADVRGADDITMTLWALFEQADRVMEVARQITESESGTLYEIEVIYLAEFKLLREHEDFPELLEALGLTDYWTSIGCRWSNDRLLCDAA